VIPVISTPGPNVGRACACAGNHAEFVVAVDAEHQLTRVLGLTGSGVLPVTGNAVANDPSVKGVAPVAPAAGPGDVVAGLPDDVGAAVISAPSTAQVGLLYPW